jgi:rod shape-determining protein MreC
MGRANSRRSTLLTAAALAAVAGGLFVAPLAVQQALRGAVLDVVVSGQSFALHRLDTWRAAEVAMPAGLPAPRAEVVAKPENDQQRALEQACRWLRLENARLREELNLAETYGVSPVPVPNARSAGVPAVVRAEIVSRQTLSRWQSVRHLNQGRARGIAESSMVLEENLPHLDQGSEAGVETEFDVFIGRCVVGRIASVGLWTSTLEPITDPHYRALAQIVRPTDQGGTFGTEGILVGLGNGLCKLTEVPTTETVRVGDEVYTSDRDGRCRIPLYYGRIKTVAEAGRHWDITVEPAVKTAELKSVAVLKLPPSFARPLAE